MVHVVLTQAATGLLRQLQWQQRAGVWDFAGGTRSAGLLRCLWQIP